MKRAITIGHGAQAGAIYRVGTRDSPDSSTHCLKLVRLNHKHMFATNKENSDPLSTAKHIHASIQRIMREMLIHKKICELPNSASFTLFESFWLQEGKPKNPQGHPVLKGIVIQMESLTCSLESYWKREREKLSEHPSFRVFIFLRALDTLMILHANNIAHGDIHCGNILLGNRAKGEGNAAFDPLSDDPFQSFPLVVKLTDFGYTVAISARKAKFKRYYSPSRTNMTVLTAESPLVIEQSDEEEPYKYDETSCEASVGNVSSYSRDFSQLQQDKAIDVWRLAMALIKMATGSNIHTDWDVENLSESAQSHLTALEKRICRFVLGIDKLSPEPLTSWEALHTDDNNRIRTSYRLMVYILKYLQSEEDRTSG